MTSYSKSQLFVSFSAEVAKVSLDTPAPRVASLPAPLHSVPLNYYTPSIISRTVNIIRTWQLARRGLRRHMDILVALPHQCCAIVEWVAGAFPFLFLRTSNVNGRLQTKLRSSFLDKYLIYASILGTHTSLLVFLSIFCFLGHEYLGRGRDLFLILIRVFTMLIIFDRLSNALALSFINRLFKDLVYSPTSYVLPVVQLCTFV